MHAAALLALYCRRFAGRAGTSFGAATLAGQHWTGIALVIPCHLFGLRLSGTVEGSPSQTTFIAGECEGAGAGVEDEGLFAASRGVWVTLPTIACPPSLTETCCTVTFCSPPVR